MKAHVSGALSLALMLGAAPAFAETLDACSHDVLHVDGTAVEVLLCAPAAPASAPRKGEGHPVEVNVAETLSANGTNFSRTVVLEFLDGREMSRTIDDVPLERVGIPKVLHLTIGYRPGVVRLEHAMLIPGAIGLK